MVAEVGDLAWSGQGRIIWLVLKPREGMLVRNSSAAWTADTRYEVGCIKAIDRWGLIQIPDDVELTDEELTLVTKWKLLNA